MTHFERIRNIVGSKVTCCVCRCTSSAMTPTCISWRPIGRYSTLASLLRETCCYATSHLPLGVTNEGRENYLPHCIKKISNAVAGDSNLQDRGVSHYLLSLLFSLLSLPF